MIDLHYTDPRQTTDWGLYLKHYGWENHSLKSGIRLSMTKSLFGTLIKVQRHNELSIEDTQEINGLSSKQSIAFIKFEPKFYSDVPILQEFGCVISRQPQSPPRTMLFDLTKDPKEYLDNVSHSGKYALNRAVREGAHVKFYKNPDDKVLEDHYKMAKETCKFKKIYIQPFNEFQVRRDIFKNNSFIGIVFDKNENPISSKFYLCSNDCVLYISGGTSKEGRKQKGGYLLMSEPLQYFKLEGYKVLDLEGLDDKRFPHFTKNWGGFSHFKEKFRGEIVDFPAPYIKNIGWIFKVLGRSRLFSL
jgi:lipid II:glycine glycyltransferase (peptidoglycan interpeptide bridge formation enzyme)